MQVTIEPVETQVGDAYILIAKYDKYHSTLVREYFSYDDALRMATELLQEKMKPELRSLFKRRKTS